MFRRTGPEVLATQARTPPLEIVSFAALHLLLQPPPPWRRRESDRETLHARGIEKERLCMQREASERERVCV